LYGLVIGILGFFPIDNAAHVGGLAGGFATARLAGEPSLLPWRERIWTWACAASVALTVAAFGEMFVKMSPLSRP